MRKRPDKYGRGSAAANGAGFVDLAPGDTYGGLELQLRARIAEVYWNQELGIEQAGNKLYAVEAVDITKDARPERTPRGAIPEGLNAAPFLDLASFMEDSIAYYVGDCNRTKPKFVNRSESFTIQRAAELLLSLLSGESKGTPS